MHAWKLTAFSTKAATEVNNDDICCMVHQQLYIPTAADACTLCTVHGAPTAADGQRVRFGLLCVYMECTHLKLHHFRGAPICRALHMDKVNM